MQSPITIYQAKNEVVKQLNTLKNLKVSGIYFTTWEQFEKYCIDGSHTQLLSDGFNEAMKLYADGNKSTAINFDEVQRHFEELFVKKKGFVCFQCKCEALKEIITYLKNK